MSRFYQGSIPCCDVYPKKKPARGYKVEKHHPEGKNGLGYDLYSPYKEKTAMLHILYICMYIYMYMPNKWRTIKKPLVHKIRLHGRREKGAAESF